MKNIQYPENSDELFNLLVHEDLVLDISFRDLQYKFTEESKFSCDKLSYKDICKLIEDTFRNVGIVIKIK